MLNIFQKFKNDNAAFKRVFESDDGKAILVHLIKKTGFRKSAFDPNNSHATAYKSGMHDVIREIILQLNMKESDIDRMINQVNNKEDI